MRAISSGTGSDRNTPAFRRLSALWQTLLEPADPINYAPFWGQGSQGTTTLAARAGVPVNALAIATLGDSLVPVAGQIALGRAAGFVEMNSPDPNYGLPLDQVLIDAAVVEGVSRLPRFGSPAAGPIGALGPHIVCDPGSDCSSNVVADASDLSCDALGHNCTDGLAAPRLSPRLLQQLWRTNLTAVNGVPGTGSALGFSALELPLLSRTGQHGIEGPQPAKPFDMDLFLANQIARYFETRGTDLEVDPCQALLASCAWNAYPPPY